MKDLLVLTSIMWLVTYIFCWVMVYCICKINNVFTKSGGSE